MKSINQWVNDIHSYAKEKGWWDNPQRTPLEIHMLVVSEVAEASECVRSNEPPFHFGCIGDVSHKAKSIVKDDQIIMLDTLQLSQIGNKEYVMSPTPNFKKPEGEAVELVDAVIRIMDYFGAKGWDLEAMIEEKHFYNQKRPYRHGGKLL